MIQGQLYLYLSYNLCSMFYLLFYSTYVNNLFFYTALKQDPDLVLSCLLFGFLLGVKFCAELFKVSIKELSRQESKSECSCIVEFIKWKLSLQLKTLKLFSDFIHYFTLLFYLFHSNLELNILYYYCYGLISHFWVYL
jgi:hypothetical protein